MSDSKCFAEIHVTRRRIYDCSTCRTTKRKKKALPIDLTLFAGGAVGEITLSPLHNPARLSFPLPEQRSLHVRLQFVRGVLVRYARSYFVFGSASLVPSLECDLGENLQASQRALVYLPWLATLFAERQPRCQGSPHIDEPARV